MSRFYSLKSIRWPLMLPFLLPLIFALALLMALQIREVMAQGEEFSLSIIEVESQNFSVSSTLSAYVTVFDKMGEPKKGLTQNDFVLDEDKASVNLDAIEEISDIQISLALVLDTDMDESEFNQTISAAQNFIEEKNKDDQIAILTFSDRVDTEAIQQFTDDQNELNDFIDKIKRETNKETRSTNNAARLGVKIAEQAEGAAGVILLTDSGDVAEAANLIDEQFIRDIKKTGIPLYVIAFDDSSKAKLEQLTDEVVGRTEILTTTQILSEIDKIVSNLREAYQLEWTSGLGLNDEVHQLRLRLQSQAETEFVTKNFNIESKVNDSPPDVNPEPVPSNPPSLGWEEWLVMIGLWILPVVLLFITTVLLSNILAWQRRKLGKVYPLKLLNQGNTTVAYKLWIEEPEENEGLEFEFTHNNQKLEPKKVIKRRRKSSIKYSDSQSNSASQKGKTKGSGTKGSRKRGRGAGEKVEQGGQIFSNVIAISGSGPLRQLFSGVTQSMMKVRHGLKIIPNTLRRLGLSNVFGSSSQKISDIQFESKSEPDSGSKSTSQSRTQSIPEYILEPFVRTEPVEPGEPLRIRLFVKPASLFIRSSDYKFTVISQNEKKEEDKQSKISQFKSANIAWYRRLFLTLPFILVLFLMSLLIFFVISQSALALMNIVFLLVISAVIALLICQWLLG